MLCMPDRSPAVDKHIHTRRELKAQAARARAQSLMQRMRSESGQGHQHLAQAKKECMESAQFACGPPDIATISFSDPSKPCPPPVPQINQIHDINLHLQETGTTTSGEELPSEKAFKCFVRAVHALQSLDLQGDVVPHIFAELISQQQQQQQQPGLLDGTGAGPSGSASYPPESPDTHVLEDEQADLYCCWAESVLLKFRWVAWCCRCCNQRMGEGTSHKQRAVFALK